MNTYSNKELLNVLKRRLSSINPAPYNISYVRYTQTGIDNFFFDFYYYRSYEEARDAVCEDGYDHISSVKDFKSIVEREISKLETLISQEKDKTMTNLTLDDLNKRYDSAKIMKSNGKIVVRYNPTSLHFVSYATYNELNINRLYKTDKYTHVLPLDEFMNLLITAIVDFKPKKKTYTLEYEVMIKTTCIETVEAYDEDGVRSYYGTSPFNLTLPNDSQVVHNCIINNNILNIKEKGK